MSDETNSAPAEAPKKSRSPFFKFVIIIVVLAVVAALGYMLMQKGGVLSKAVAMVNGEKVSQARFDDYSAQVAAVFASQGQDITKEETKVALKQRVIDDLIAETLILQKAREANINVNQEAVDTQFEQAKSQFADEAAFQAELTKQGFTEATFKETLERQNVFQQYISTHIDVSGAKVTDKEIKDFYDQAKASSDNIPEFEAVKAQIEAEILRQKQQALVTEYVQKLRADSQVEIL